MNNKIGIFQVIYTKYVTSTNKERTKREFIFLDELYYNNSLELINKTKDILNRYKTYNNIIILDYDKIQQGYIFSKSRYTSLLLTTTTKELQQGVKIELKKGW
jgi:hypothetical protein